MTILQTDHQLP